MRDLRFLGRLLVLCGLLAASVGVYFLLAWLLVVCAGLLGVRVPWAVATVLVLLIVTVCLVSWMLVEMRRAPFMEEVRDE
ncbi:MAG: hypothetical protein KHX65_00085 [Bifidobacterium sp.]|uniref:hypothetical protein n=1 Tax=Bifidobacterium sp. TaxID=41200 RepID=UPI00257C7BD9|nr:hypothetical protein [Bifidobacterium sp.]MBS5400346.1 hypothetical protein [Bifidobacterium sp.]